MSSRRRHAFLRQQLLRALVCSHCNSAKQNHQKLAELWIKRKLWVVATQIFFDVHPYLEKLNPIWRSHIFPDGTRGKTTKSKFVHFFYPLVLRPSFKRFKTCHLSSCGFEMPGGEASQKKPWWMCFFREKRSYIVEKTHQKHTRWAPTSYKWGEITPMSRVISPVIHWQGHLQGLYLHL